MKRYDIEGYDWGKYDDANGEWVKYSEMIKDLKIIYKSLIVKDYIAAEELLSEILEEKDK